MRRLSLFAVAAAFLSLIAACGDASGTGNGRDVNPFSNIALEALGEKAFIDNRYPGAALFDYDKDGDLDIYVTQADASSPYGETLPETKGGTNRLFRNDGNNKFSDVGSEAGVGAPDHNSTGVAACDFDNDGYKDLYVAGYGRIGDGLDYRSVDEVPGLREAVTDRIFFNNGDGTFRDATREAFGDDANVRSAISAACADVDGDGWLDIFVSNRADQDYIRFDVPWHHGHYNALFMNNRDGTFDESAEEAGLRTGPIIMRDVAGEPITFFDPATGQSVEGYDPSRRDAANNFIGEPTGQTLSAMFFDHDNDGDSDLWVADDGDTLKIFRNDSTPGLPRLVSIGEQAGVDKVGAWMGFALGDIDGDEDLDVFVTNIAYHPLTRGLPQSPGGDCAYAHQFEWGTCFHYLLRNDGVAEMEGIGTVGMFTDVAAETAVEPDPYLPTQALNDDAFNPSWEDTPRGLQAYDFGFGTAFFDYENDGDQDLYWLGAMADRGEGPRGMFWPGTGRMLQGNGDGDFSDVTVESRLLDVLGADYDAIEGIEEGDSLLPHRIGYEFHENGKGLAKGDLNGDGYVDLVGTNSRGFVCDPAGRAIQAPVQVCPQSNGLVSVVGGPLFIWINGTAQGNYLTFRLQGRQGIDGTGSNADAIGARVYVTAKADGETPTRQVQELVGGSSFLSSNSTDITFGIGQAEKADEVEIRWPSGKMQKLNGLDANKLHEITEPR